MQITIDKTPVWITYFSENECKKMSANDEDVVYTEGYYWAVCSPGCIPDSEFSGPFESESDAESDAENILNW